MPTPNLPDLDAMSFDELWTMHEELTKILSGRLLSEKRELERRLAKLIPSDPHKVDDPDGEPERRSSGRKYHRVQPKYINPFVPSQTWSGRGRLPRWLSSALEQGRRLDEFEIKKADVEHTQKTDEEEPPG